MSMSTIVWRELSRRKVRLLLGLAAVGLAVASFVCVTALSRSWQGAIRAQLQSLGPNAFLVPRQTPISSFHRSEFGPPMMPEHYLAKLRGQGILRRGMAAPAILFTTQINGQKVLLRGRDEAVEFQAAVATPPVDVGQVVLGAEAAERLALGPGQTLTVRGRQLLVKAVRPKLGTVADMEVLCNLQELQGLLGAEGKLTLIELVVTERAEADRLAREIPALLPEVRLITRHALLGTQRETLATARRYAMLLVCLIVLVATLGIALEILTNVRERRREIGVLMAIGASRRQVLRLFMQKAALIGLGGGAGGYLIGTVAAGLIGPRITGQSVAPSLGLLAASLAAGVVLCVLAAVPPALAATRLSPALALSER